MSLSCKVELPKKSGIYGVWMDKEKEDDDIESIQVYLSKEYGVIIGQNKSQNDKIYFSDLALAFSPDGKATFQYADESGNAQVVDLTTKQACRLLYDMLAQAKDRHQK